VPLLLLASLLTQASAPSTRAEAQRLFTQGEAQFAARAVSDAEQSFEKSYSLLPLSATAWNLARCAETGNQHAKALGWYRRYLRLEATAKDRPQVEASIRALEKRLAARGTQALTVFVTPAEATASVDDGAPTGDGATVELKAGRHAVKVQAAGFVTAQLEVVSSLAAGDSHADASAGLIAAAFARLRGRQAARASGAAAQASLHMDRRGCDRGRARHRHRLWHRRHERVVGAPG